MPASEGIERLKTRRRDIAKAKAAGEGDAVEGYMPVVSPPEERDPDAEGYEPIVEPAREPGPSKEFKSREEYKGFRMPKGMSLPQRRKWKQSIDAQQQEKLAAMTPLAPTVIASKAIGSPAGEAPATTGEPESMQPMEGATGEAVVRRGLDVAGSLPVVGEAADVTTMGLDLRARDYPAAAISGASVLLPFVSAGWLKRALSKGEVPPEAAKKIADLEKRYEAGDVTDDMQIRRELAGIEDAHASDYQASLGDRDTDFDFESVSGKPPPKTRKEELEEILELDASGPSGYAGGGEYDADHPYLTSPKYKKMIDDAQKELNEIIRVERSGGGGTPGGGKTSYEVHPDDFRDDPETRRMIQFLLDDAGPETLAATKHVEDLYAAGKLSREQAIREFDAVAKQKYFDDAVDPDAYPNLSRPETMYDRAKAGGGGAVSDKLTPEDRKYLQDEIRRANEALRKNPNETSLVTEQYRDMYQHMLDNDTKLYAGEVVTRDLPSIRGGTPGGKPPGGVGRSVEDQANEIQQELTALSDSGLRERGLIWDGDLDPTVEDQVEDAFADIHEKLTKNPEIAEELRRRSAAGRGGDWEESFGEINGFDPNEFPLPSGKPPSGGGTPGGGAVPAKMFVEGWGGDSKLTNRYTNEMMDKLAGEIPGKLPKSVYRDQLIKIQRMGEQEAAILGGEIKVSRAESEKIFADNAETRQKMAEFIQRREGGGRVSAFTEDDGIDKYKQLVMQYADEGRPFSFTEVFTDPSQPFDLDLYKAVDELVAEGRISGPSTDLKLDKFGRVLDHNTMIYTKTPGGGRSVGDIEGPSEAEIQQMIETSRFGDPEELEMLKEDMRRMAELEQGAQIESGRVRRSRTPGAAGASGKVPEGTSRAERKGTVRERPKKKD